MVCKWRLFDFIPAVWPLRFFVVNAIGKNKSPFSSSFTVEESDEYTDLVTTTRDLLRLPTSSVQAMVFVDKRDERKGNRVYFVYSGCNTLDI